MMALGGKKVDLTGQVFGRLTVKGISGQVERNRTLWTCECECGNVTEVRTYTLTSGSKKSCGCLHREGLVKRNTRHGKAGTPEYRAWQHMKGRCYDPNNKHYKDYGQRGITVCVEWINDFDRFLADIGPKPSIKHSLDRIDVNGNYEPTNCRWATTTQQARNTRCRRESSTGVKGVYPYKNNRFIASIHIDSKPIHLGIFNTLEEAAEARKQAEEKYWGDQK